MCLGQVQSRSPSYAENYSLAIEGRSQLGARSAVVWTGAPEVLAALRDISFASSEQGRASGLGGAPTRRVA